ncbi:MAG: hypothetical protein V3V62_11990, partial [bacterium]
KDPAGGRRTRQGTPAPAEPSGETRRGGAGPGRGGAGPGRGGIAVRFSRGEIADDLILRLLENEMRGAILVTSDRALGEAAREFAGAVVRTGEFRDRLLQARHMEGEEGGEEGEDRPPPSSRQTTKKRGNPRRLPKKERQRRGRLGKL